MLSASTGGASTYYERDPSGSLIAERGPAGEFSYITDGLGSTVALVDTTGTVQATYSYDPYGTTITVGGPNPVIANGNPFRYAGGYLDTATGPVPLRSSLLQPRHRALDPTRQPQHTPGPHQRQPLHLHRRRPHQRNRPEWTT